jgi:hypothetical protein
MNNARRLGRDRIISSHCAKMRTRRVSPNE